MSERETGAVGFVIPDEQRMRYTICPQPGARIPLKNIGSQLRALGRLLEAFAQDAPDAGRWIAVLDGIEMTADGEISFDVAILPDATPAKDQPHD